MIYGYIRVSTKDQNEARQFVAMQDFGIEKKNIFIDKQSGKDFDRPQYKRLLRKIKFEDVFVVKSIDRLGRNYDEIIEQWKIITKEKKADIVVLDMPILDTRQTYNLAGKLISDIVLELLSYVAETERDNIRQRQAEGIAIAKENGVKFGRPPQKLPLEFYGAFNEWKSGKITCTEAANRCNMPISTFRYRCENYSKGID